MEQINECPLRFQARRQPQQTAIKSDQLRLTFKQLDRHIDLLGKQLIEQGMTTGDRLACIAANSINLILLQLTCVRYGLIFCPINPRFSHPEIQSRLAILNTPFLYLAQTEAVLALPSLSLDFTLRSESEATLPELKIDPLQVIDIIFTSGSSGQPKAVMHHFSNHFYSALGAQEFIPLQAGDKNLLSLPLFHISGYATVMRTILAGATLILSEQKLTIALLEEQQITHLSLVCTQLYRLLAKSEFKQCNLPIKHLLLGGSAFPNRQLAETARRGFNYHLSYGLTEMSSQVATSSNSQSLVILKYRELKIVENEILLRGKTRFAGYFKDAVTTSLLPQEAWFASNDLGKNTANIVQIMGRKDRLFISGGENIQPEEIERLLLTFAAVKQAYIVAVDDPYFGKRPVAFIDWEHTPNTEELNHYLQKKLSRYKMPVHYFLLAPQSSIKVSLTQLQAHAQRRVNKLRLSAGERP
ncbi:o-succinylbenzoate--CoA ligase [Psychromonas antarctica]|uniref:o-succinylbenzoate--CoA ligase n=1 Tax=Psychromonas antarctica TaxID=67573 RepID=UPI001EE7A011|nr:o-succinylbenzoate--CoA ligase [Psychromonas antarctica]MCG6201587.1 o-succinylbenzoate--CoA ligase [Psychromonas antarctica]